MNKFLNILLVLSLGVVIQCGKSDKSQANNKKTETKVESRYVSAKGGLRMRDKPDTSGNKIGTIPTGTKVDLLEEKGEDMTIAGATGKWSKVKWGDKTGWVFGGFLSTQKRDKSLLNVKELFYTIKKFKSPLCINVRVGELCGTPKKLVCNYTGNSGNCSLTKLVFTNDEVIFHIRLVEYFYREGKPGSEGETINQTTNSKCTVTKNKFLGYIDSDSKAEILAVCK